MLPDAFHQRLRASSWCQSHAAQLTTWRLLAGGLDWLLSWQFHAHCWKFTSFAILFHDFGSFCTHGVQPTPLSSTRTKWSTFVYNISFHCPRQRTADWRNRPRKGTYPILCYHILGACPTTPAQ
jgi:hypothetical protein